MAEFIIGVASGIVIEIGKYVIKPIRHQVGYVVFYNKNKNELKQQLESLENTKKKVDLKVKDAESNAYTIFPEVLKWLVKVDNELKKHDELSNSDPPCFNFLQRHQLSRKANKRAKDICELKDRGNNFSKVGCHDTKNTTVPAPLPDTNNTTVPAPLPDTKKTTVPEGYQILESKTSMAKQIKDALAKPEVKKVGIYGMGGVGKTYLLNEVKKLVVGGEDKLFDLAIEVSVSKSDDIINIQQQIGELLNITVPTSLKGIRASFLRNALEKMGGNILIMLDDLWKEYDLIKEVGIPLSKEGCKILMTSRDKSILISSNMVSKKYCFCVTCLDEKESWKFFVTIIGNEFDTVVMENVAKDVARECGGLPLALHITAKTLLKEKDIDYWQNVLSNLRINIALEVNKGVFDRIYASVRSSYDNLNGDEAKLIFLLCSVFPDDYVISVKDLQMYAMSMRLLEMVSTRNQAKNRVLNLVQDLTLSSLLQLQEVNHQKDDKHVKMHDIVRDVAIYIGKDVNMSTLYYGYSTSSKGPDWDNYGPYRAIFVDCKKFCNLIPNVKFPELELLILRFSIWGSEKYIEIVDAHFQGMENLKVLDMRGTSFLRPFWTSLKKLRTLCLSCCECKDIDTIWHLKELEILRISNCSGMTNIVAAEGEGEEENGEIVFNKLIEFSLHNLPRLASFYDGKCRLKFPSLETMEIEECNEMETFSNGIISIEEDKASVLPAPFFTHKVSFPTLEKLSIKGGNNLKMLWDNNGSIASSSCKLQQISIRDCNKLRYMFPSITVTSLILLDTLEISDCELLERIFEIETWSFGDIRKVSDLPLTNLTLEGLPNLKYVWNNDAGEVLGFPDLKEVKVTDCPKLSSIFPASFTKHIEQIERLEVDKRNEIFAVDEVKTLGEVVSFRSLRTLKMSCKQAAKESFWDISEFFQLQRLTLVGYEDDKMITLPKKMNEVLYQVENLEIKTCFELEQVFGNDQTQSCTKNINQMSTTNTFFNLNFLQVWRCDGMMNLFSSSVVKNLVNLSSMKIYRCERMTSIVAAEEEENGEIVFKRLTHLEFVSLPRLACFHSGKCGLQFPELKILRIDRCNNMKIFSYGIANTPDLKCVRIGENNISMLPTLGIDDIIKSFFRQEIGILQGIRNVELSLKSVTKSFWHKPELLFDLKKLKLVGSEDDDIVCLPFKMSEVLYNIERFEIENALQLVQVFGNNNNDVQRCAKLKKLCLWNLPKLRHVWKESCEVTTISFDSLEWIEVRECENLKCILPSSVTFLNLKFLLVDNCNKMRNLFSFSVVKNLVNLSSIWVYDCERMTCIVSAEGEKGEIVFEHLNNLRLYGLPRLGGFHTGKCMIKFPSLNTLELDGCNKMERFSYGILRPPKLKFLMIEGREFQVSPGQNINGVIQTHFQTTQQEEESDISSEDEFNI